MRLEAVLAGFALGIWVQELALRLQFGLRKFTNTKHPEGIFQGKLLSADPRCLDSEGLWAWLLRLLESRLEFHPCIENAILCATFLPQPGGESFDLRRDDFLHIVLFCLCVEDAKEFFLLYR